jgi:hypothetical protein
MLSAKTAPAAAPRAGCAPARLAQFSPPATSRSLACARPPIAAACRGCRTL